MRTPTGRDHDHASIDARLLARLALQLSQRSADELSEIAGANPDLVHEWTNDLRRRREGLETELHALDEALERLLGARGNRERGAK